jgi:aryl-alcohol dehydrogenase-like predicted oxidoreductase
MERRVLPGTGLDLSVVGFGAWAIGGEYWGPVQDAESIDAIHAALDLGINWFDTAPIYGSGHSDTVLAAALRGRPEALIFTKVGPRPDPETGHVLSDLTPDHVMADCEASLQRLGTERIALLQVHWPCELGTPMADTIGALDTLVSAGKVERYGLCNYPADTLSRCLEFGSISSFQTPYSMIRREFEAELRTVVMGRETPVGVLVYETLCRGLLTGKYGPAAPTFDDDDLRSHDDRFRQPSFGRIHRLNEALAVIARRLSIPPAALPVAWALTRPGVTGAIVGAKTRAQIIETARAAELIGRRKLWEVVERYAAQVRP